MLQEPCSLRDGPRGGRRCPGTCFPLHPSKRCRRQGLALSAGAESRSPLSEHPIDLGGPRGLWESLTEELWTLLRIQSTDVCVLEGKSGDGQDTPDPNKVLREAQSHPPPNSEKTHKPMKEEGTRREKAKSLPGRCGVRGLPRQAPCWLLPPSARRTRTGHKQPEFGQEGEALARPHASCSGCSP